MENVWQGWRELPAQDGRCRKPHDCDAAVFRLNAFDPRLPPPLAGEPRVIRGELELAEKVGSPAVELLNRVDLLYTQLLALTVMCTAPASPSSPPLNAAVLTTQKGSLETMKATQRSSSGWHVPGYSTRRMMGTRRSVSVSRNVRGIASTLTIRNFANGPTATEANANCRPTTIGT